ncbi:hypothetical protein M514_06153 [Trichuris suis]|uniref:Uncharacterized protein n=1 Tax=Trichuris suis TaxID=68888 RepID=A0A085NK26_9BILA|nr:hypothetical protein M513_06153 [Trichuris suis]KFD69822.1 hypothetical protein M514_06153 [Trichuris suis]
MKAYQPVTKNYVFESEKIWKNGRLVARARHRGNRSKKQEEQFPQSAYRSNSDGKLIKPSHAPDDIGTLRRKQNDIVTTDQKKQKDERIYLQVIWPWRILRRGFAWLPVALS